MDAPDTRRSSAAARLSAIPTTAKVLGAVVVALLCGAMANAYEQYSLNRDATYCRACHGDFRGTAPYTSQSDGVQWKNPSTLANLNLHDGHRTYMLSGDCGTCHTASRFPVATMSSDGGTGLPAISCLGCHGRAEPGQGNTVTGAGLRQHHFRRGVTDCLECHSDADPANLTTANEHTFPPYYSMPDASHPNKPANPCNIGGSESAVAPPLGLDNDGDLIYDGAEPECDPVPVQGSTWGRIKTLYR